MNRSNRQKDDFCPLCCCLESTEHVLECGARSGKLLPNGFWYLTEEEHRFIDACGAAPRGAPVRCVATLARLRGKRDEWKRQQKTTLSTQAALVSDQVPEDFEAQAGDPFASANERSEKLQAYSASLVLRKMHFRRSWNDIELELKALRLLDDADHGEQSAPTSRKLLLQVIRSHSSFDGPAREFAQELSCARCGLRRDSARFSTFSCSSCRLATPHCVRVFRTSIKSWATDAITRHGETLRRRSAMHESVPGRLTSYLDGTVALATRSTDCTVLDIDLYCDGFNVSHFSRYSITVFYVRLKNLPPHARETTLLACLDGAIPQFSYDVVVHDWVKELKVLSTNGFEVGGARYRVRLHSLLGDAPALRKLTAFRGGSFLNTVFCTQCKASRPQERIQRSQADQNAEPEDSDEDVEETAAASDSDSELDDAVLGMLGSRIMPIAFVPLGERRTADQTRADGIRFRKLAGKSREEHSKATGHRWTSLYELDGFDVIRQAPCDTMHVLFHGIARDVINHIEVITKANRSVLRDRLADATRELPATFTRCTLESRRTAAWYRAMILYYLPVLLEFVPAAIAHSLLALRDIALVVGDVCPRRADVESLRDRARVFVEGWTSSAHVSVVRSLNYHSLLHVCDTILECGPGPESACWNFETHHQAYKGIKTNNVNVPKQITDQDGDCQRASEILFRLIRSCESDDVREHAREILGECGYCDELETDRICESDIRGDADLDGQCAALLTAADVPESQPNAATLQASSRLTTYLSGERADQSAIPVLGYLKTRVQSWIEAEEPSVKELRGAKVFRYRFLALTGAVLELNAPNRQQSIVIGRVDRVFAVESASMPDRAIVIQLTLLKTPTQRAKKNPVLKYCHKKKAVTDKINNHSVLVEDEPRDRERIFALISDIRRRHTLVPVRQTMRDDYGTNVYYDVPGTWVSK